MRSPGTTRFARHVVVGMLVAGWGLGDAGFAAAATLIGGDESMRLAFPDCTMVHKTVFLTEAQLKRAGEHAGEKLPSAVVHPYEAHCRGALGGVVYFDVSRVRTLPQRLMVAISTQGEVLRVEVLSFDEPRDYLPRRAWYEQFDAKPLSDDLDLDGSIRRVAGATLTARATVTAVRRALAVHRVLYPAPGAGRAEATAP